MDKQNKLDDWTDEEVAELKKFCESPVGKKYIKRLKDLKEDVVRVCIYSPERDVVTRFAGIACGYESAIEDIQMLSKSKKKEEDKGTKK